MMVTMTTTTMAMTTRTAMPPESRRNAERRGCSRSRFFFAQAGVRAGLPARLSGICLALLRFARQPPDEGAPPRAAAALFRLRTRKVSFFDTLRL
jgi:hypothetical protein